MFLKFQQLTWESEFKYVALIRELEANSINGQIQIRSNIDLIHLK